MEKEQAIQILQQQLNLANDFLKKAKYSNITASQEFIKWKRDTSIAVEHIFGAKSKHLQELKHIRFTPTVLITTQISNSIYTAATNGINRCSGLLASMIKEVEQYGINQDLEKPDKTISLIETICNRFHIVARQLNVRHNNRPTLSIKDEYDVQDLLYALLALHFDDIRPEDVVPKHAGKSTRVDFLLKKEQIVIEVKKTRLGLESKEVGDQLILDIRRYQSHPDCKKLVCFVYDPEQLIDNPYELENDLTGKHNNLNVQVIVTPKGF